MIVLHTVFDEIKYFQREPTPAEHMSQYFEWGVDSADNIRSIGAESWIDAEAKNQARRTYEKLKRRKEMENCLHGRFPYPVHWKPGVHPLGAQEFWVTIEGMGAQPYRLSEGDHDILHQLKKAHTHV